MQDDRQTAPRAPPTGGQSRVGPPGDVVFDYDALRAGFLGGEFGWSRELEA